MRQLPQILNRQVQLLKPRRNLARVMTIAQDTASTVMPLRALAVLGILGARGIEAVNAGDGGPQRAVVCVVIVDSLAVETELREAPLKEWHGVFGGHEVVQDAVEASACDGGIGGKPGICRRVQHRILRDDKSQGHLVDRAVRCVHVPFAGQIDTELLEHVVEIYVLLIPEGVIETRGDTGLCCETTERMDLKDDGL